MNIKVLALDSSCKVATVALCEEDTVLYECNVQNGLTHSQTLMPMIDDCLKTLHLTAADVDLFSCSVGPGSFTGLRIGIGTVQGLAYSVGRPVVGVNTLEAMAHNITGEERLICPMLDARRRQVYTGFYRREGGKIRQVQAPSCIVVDELVQQICEPVIFLGDAAVLHKAFLTEALGPLAAFAPMTATFPRAASVALAALEKEPCSPAELAPVYLRKSQAEQELEEKQNQQKRW